MDFFKLEETKTFKKQKQAVITVQHNVLFISSQGTFSELFNRFELKKEINNW